MYKIFIIYKADDLRIIKENHIFSNLNGRALYLARMQKQKTVLSYKMIGGL